MSNLDYPISLLIAKGKEISTALQLSGDNQMKLIKQLSDIREAFCILNTVKLKDEMKERHKQNMKDINDKNIKL